MTFKDKFLAAIDKRSGQARDLMGDFNDILRDIDWSTHFEELNQAKKSLMRRGSELFDEMNDFLKEIKDSVTDFSVVVPYNSSVGEKYNYEIKDGNLLVVNVTYDDGMTCKNYVTKARIPDNCDIEKLDVTINKDNLLITIPKIINVTADTINHIESDSQDESQAKKKKTQPLSDKTKKLIEQIARKNSQKAKGHKSILGTKRFKPRMPQDN